MPTHRQALQKLMDNPTKLKAWKKKYGDATLANFTKASERFSKPVNEIKPSGIKKPGSGTTTPTAGAFGVSTKKNNEKKDTTKVEIGKGASNKLEGSGGVGEQPTSRNKRKTLKNIEKLKRIEKRGKNKEARLDRRADRIAARKGFEGAGEFNEDGTPNDEAMMKARKEGRAVIAKRKAGRKKFLMDFGSQLTRGVQSGERRAFGVDENGKRVVTGSGAFVEQSGDTNAEANAEANEIENKRNETDILEKIDTGGGDNSTLGVFGKDYSTFGAEYDTTVPNLTSSNNSSDGIGKKIDLANIPINKISPFAKVEEDSDPSSFMKKQFFKKMGY